MALWVALAVVARPALAQDGFAKVSTAPVTVTPTLKKAWEAGSGIGVTRHDQTIDTAIPQDGRMIAPQDQRAVTAGGAGGVGGGFPDPTKWQPHVVKVRPGQVIDCAVEEATDYDHWTQDLNAEQVNSVTQGGGKVAEDWVKDTVHYQWSVTGPGTSTTAAGSLSSPTQTTTQWTAPAAGTGVAGTYTLSCTIDDSWNDTTNTGATAPDESGTRNDPPVVRSVPIVIEQDDSWAELQLSKSDSGGDATETPAGTVVGGKLWGSLQVHVGLNQHLDASQSSVTVRIEETDTIHRGQTNPLPYSDVEVSLANWQHYDTGTGQWVNGGDPTAIAAQNTEFRTRFSWDTTTVPLGHNGNHILSLVKVTDNDPDTVDADQAQLRFVKNGGEKYDSGPSGLSVDVQNLVITDVSSSNGTQDYFKWDSLSGVTDLEHPTINFTIKDEGGPGVYRWIIYFQKTSDVHSTPDTDWTANARKAWGTRTSSGAVPVDLSDSNTTGHLIAQTPDDPETESDESEGTGDERSPYVYDIRVVKFPTLASIPTSLDSEDGEIGRAQFKQPYLLWIPHQFQTPDSAPEDGHDMWFKDLPDGSSEIRAKYYLFPNPATNAKAANRVALIAMDPTFAERGSVSGPTNAGVLHDGVDEDNDTIKDGLLVGNINEDDVSGDWRVLFTAEDGAGQTRRRDHTNTRMILVNQLKTKYKVNLNTDLTGDKYSLVPLKGHPVGFEIPWGKSNGSLGYKHFRVIKYVLDSEFPTTAPDPETIYFTAVARADVALPVAMKNRKTLPLSAQRIRRDNTPGQNFGGKKPEMGSDTPVATWFVGQGITSQAGAVRLNFASYETGPSAWNITKSSGRWDVNTQSSIFQRSNGWTFKINKRSQIVDTAIAWTDPYFGYQYARDVPDIVGGKTDTSANPYHNGNACDAIVRYIYDYLGLTVNLNGTVQDLFATTSTIVDNKAGSLSFYRKTPGMDHVGILIGGGSMVDQNHGAGSQIRVHAENDPRYNDYIIEKSVHRTIPEIQQLDKD